MNIFAHNGVDHATAAEAATHSLTSVILITVLVTAAVGLLAYGAVYLVNRFALKEVPIKGKEKDD